MCRSLKSIKISDAEYLPNSIKCLNKFVEQSGLCVFICYKNTDKGANKIKYHEVSNLISKKLYGQLDIKYPDKPKSVSKKFNYFMFLLTVHKMLDNYDNEERIVKFNKINQRYIF